MIQNSYYSTRVIFSVNTKLLSTDYNLWYYFSIVRTCLQASMFKIL